MTYLRPDSKSQVTIEYDEQTNHPKRVHTIVVSTQHDEFIQPADGLSEKEAERQMQQQIREDVRTILIPRVRERLKRAHDQLADLIGDDYILHVNPTGKFVIGGPHGDTGLTGRKIIVDTYGGRGAHGGGAFSARIRRKSTVRQPTQRGISPKTWLLRALPTRCWSNCPMPSASPSRCRFTSTPIVHPVRRDWRE